MIGWINTLKLGATGRARCGPEAATHDARGHRTKDLERERGSCERLVE